jgi:protein NEDD1
VLYTTAARVGGGGGVDAVRWQTAPEGALVAESRAAAAAEAVTPTPMRLNRGGGDRASSFEDGGFARTPGSDDAVDLGTNAAAASPRLFPSPAAAAAANPSSFGASLDASARAADAPPTPTMGKTPTNAGASASAGRARSLSPTEEETRRRVERLMSARGAGGTPEALAAATRPTRGDPRGDPDSGPADADALAGMIAEAVREAVRESLEASVRAEVRNVHLEVIRQFHDAREEQTRMFEEVRAAQAALARDVAALRRSQREFVRR